jgi:hypothetical protein
VALQGGRGLLPAVRLNDPTSINPDDNKMVESRRVFLLNTFFLTVDVHPAARDRTHVSSVMGIPSEDGARAVARPRLAAQIGFKGSEYRSPLMDELWNELDPPNQLRAAY